jgi:O-antigen ligase
MYFYPMESHNGYLDTINDLGFLGLGVLLLFLGFYLRQGLQLMKYDRNQAALYLALLLEAMVINMSESDWFSRTDTFAVLVLGMTCITRALIAHRARS